MAQSGRSWLKYGCLGCLGIVGMLVLVLGLVAFVAARSARSETVAEEQMTPQIPAPPALETMPGEQVDPAEAATVVASGATGRVLLDLRGAEFEVEPARPGEGLSVDATYDKNSYELTESLQTDGDAGWTYEVKFHRTGSGLMTTLRQLFGASTPRVVIYLPVDMPIALELVIREGGAVVDLGGLWLTTVEVQFDKGGMELGFSDPTQVPLEQFTVTGSMGGASLRRLGNASPAVLDIDFSMGGMDIDLSGDWVADSDISVSQTMGGASVRLPRGVKIVGIEGHDRIVSRPAEIEPPTLRFTVSGEVEYR